MKFNKKDIIISAIIIIVFLLLLFLPNIIDLIPSKNIQYLISIIVSILVFLGLIYGIFNDIRKREFTTTVYIVLADITILISYIVLMYTCFHNLKASNIDIEYILQQNRIRIICLLSMLCASMLLSFLKSERFIKKT